jgi:RNA polymerase sigma-70 factor, ECF subfamily
VGGPEETELVRRARRGDASAYEVLVRRYQRIAHRTAYLIAGKAEADDAAQQAFVKAYRALARFDPSRPFRPWLLRIVANEARNLRRSAGRRAGLELTLSAEPEPEPVAPSPEHESMARERRQALLQAMSQLSEGDREVLGLRYFLDLSEAEMVEAMGVPAGTVKSRLSRAMERLREAAAEVGLTLDEEVAP